MAKKKNSKIKGAANSLVVGAIQRSAKKPQKLMMKRTIKPINRTKKIVGENTGEVKTDKEGHFALVSENQKNGVNKGDTIRTTPENLGKNKNYIKGGDYKVKKTGNKKYKIK
jgi:hypothetical protein